jgi:N-acetylmuramoyl-L-alanine amidase
MIQRQRTEWIIIHCSGTDGDTPESIKKRELAEGCKDYSCHYLILPDGKLIPGRPELEYGAHCKGANDVSIGVMLVGCFDRQPPTTEQMETLIALSNKLCQKYMLTTRRIAGYNETLLGRRNKITCPGKMVNMDSIREQVLQCLKEESIKNTAILKLVH